MADGTNVVCGGECDMLVHDDSQKSFFACVFCLLNLIAEESVSSFDFVGNRFGNRLRVKLQYEQPSEQSKEWRNGY
jgi:hypothetical protein